MSFSIDNNNILAALEDIYISDNDLIETLNNYKQQFFTSDDDLISCLIQYENDTDQHEEDCIMQIIENIISDIDIEDEMPVNYVLITGETEFRHSEEYIFELHNAIFENQLHETAYISHPYNDFFAYENFETEIVETTTTSSTELSSFINFFENINQEY